MRGRACPRGAVVATPSRSARERPLMVASVMTNASRQQQPWPVCVFHPQAMKVPKANWSGKFLLIVSEPLPCLLSALNPPANQTLE